MHRRVFLFCIALLALRSVAQKPAPLTASALVTKLHENAVAYEARLPSLACREHIVSQFMQEGKVVRAVTVDDVVRALRKPDANSGMEEVRLPLDRDGEPQEHQVMPPLPLLISDSLYGGQHSYTDLAKNLACNAWELDTSGSKLRLSYRRNLNPAPEANCKDTNDGMAGFSLVDRTTGQMVFDQHTLSAEASQRQHRATYAEMNFAPVLLGEETFWLPQRVYAEMGKTLRFTATYTGCKRYAASARVLEAEPPK